MTQVERRSRYAAVAAPWTFEGHVAKMMVLVGHAVYKIRQAMNNDGCSEFYPEEMADMFEAAEFYAAVVGEPLPDTWAKFKRVVDAPDDYGPDGPPSEREGPNEYLKHTAETGPDYVCALMDLLGDICIALVDAGSFECNHLDDDWFTDWFDTTGPYRAAGRGGYRKFELDAKIDAVCNAKREGYMEGKGFFSYARAGFEEYEDAHECPATDGVEKT